MQSPYILKTERLGLRTWRENDLESLARMNADPEVMRYFPSTLTKSKTEQMLQRLQQHFETHGYTYYAAESLDTREFMGFVGLAYQSYETAYTPFTDIGWRLKQEAWGKGYATEAAKAVLIHAKENLQLKEIHAVTPLPNLGSERVMQKIGMTKIAEFEHPEVPEGHELRRCVLYRKVFEED
ncbi:MAG: GNAT family N-acetyltransferase [Bacteroidota bacterium]